MYRCCMSERIKVKLLRTMIMHYILLIGAAYNILGGVRLFLSALREAPLTPSQPGASPHLPLFVAGTAFVFGSMYLYLFLNLKFLVPFLLFGAALKTWAFLISIFLYRKGHIRRKVFLEFGLANGIIAFLFWVYIAVMLSSL